MWDVCHLPQAVCFLLSVQNPLLAATQLAITCYIRVFARFPE